VALLKAREDVAQGRARYPSSVTGKAAYGRPCEVGGSKAARWIESPRDAGLRFVCWADEAGGRYSRAIDHKGWFTSEDNFTGEVLRGAVYQLPGRGGRPLFVAAYGDPNNGSADQGGPALFDFESVFEGEAGEESPSLNEGAKEAARAADSFAERAAESEREYQEAWQAGSRWADLGQELTGTRQEVRALIADLKAARDRISDKSGLDRLCAVIRARIVAARESMAELAAERDSLLETFRPRAWYRADKESSLRDAFNEGAGETVLTV
jgi:hypothetical protein